MIMEVINNHCCPVIASEAKQSHSVNNSRLLRHCAPRNDMLAEVRV
jgi:hypothetical protein